LLFQCLAIFSASGFFSVWQYFQHLAISASGDFRRYKFLKAPMRSATKPPSQQQRSAMKPMADTPTSGPKAADACFFRVWQFFQHLAFSASGDIFSIWLFQRLVIFGDINF
jgi:hypothetical protein